MCRRARLQGVGSSFILDRRKETAALIFSKPPLQMGVSKELLYDGFFLLPSCGRFDKLFSLQNFLMDTFMQLIGVRYILNAGLTRRGSCAFFSWCSSWVLCRKQKISTAASSYVPPCLYMMLGSSFILDRRKETAALILICSL